MKKAFIGLLILILSAWAQYVFSAEPIQLARMNPYVAGGVSAAAVNCNTTIPSSNTRLSAEGSAIALGSETARYYVGQIIESPGTHTICKHAIRVNSIAGSGGTLYSQIWELSSTLALATMVEESANTYSVSAGTTYDFTHNFAFDTGKKYAIVVTLKATSGTNYIYLEYLTSNQDNYYSYYGRWKADSSYASSNSDYSLRGQYYEE